jgi:hypothetical protein
MKKLTSILLISIAVVSGCKKEDAPLAEDFGYNYFPDKVGIWVEYQVDSVWRDDTFNVLDSVSYRLKQVVAAHYTDPGGRPAMRIERFKLVEDEWVIRDVWSAVRSTSALEVTEENVRRLKLSFPVREGRAWNANVYNTEGELEVAASEVGSGHQVNDLSFASTVAVRSTVPANPLTSRDLYERYASGVGMIEHHWFHRTVPNFEPDAPVVSVRYDMKAVAYGSE